MPEFADLSLPACLLDAVHSQGFSTPTAIQAAAIPPLIEGRDVTGVAQTGTGKTAAFGLPLLAAVDPSAHGVQALVLTPTRELAVQVAGALDKFAAAMRGVSVTAIYGGAPMGRQITALRRGSQVVVGTPGRVIDLIDRGALKLDQVRFAVLDEADEMLHMGFVEEVDRILSEAPPLRQTALFSATMPSGIRRVASRHLTDPVDVSVAASATPVPAIRQRFAVLPFRDKITALKRVLAMRDGDASVVFVRTRAACDEVGTQLIGSGLKAAVISGDVTQVERERTIARLKGGQVDVLVATDVAARGLDVERIGLVVNFDCPADPEIYIHRVGRTGRAGRSGEALTFFTPKEVSRRKSIERTIGQRLESMTIPGRADIAAHRATAALTQATERLAAGRLETFRSALQAAAEQADVSVVDVAAALLASAVGDDGVASDDDELIQSAHDDDRHGSHHSKREDRSGRGQGKAARQGEPGVPYVVQVGRRHGVRPAGIVGAIAGEGNLPGSAIGRITIRDSHSIVEICQPVRADSLARISKATVSGQQLRIRRDQPGPAHSASRTRPDGAPQQGWKKQKARKKPRSHSAAASR